MLAPPYTRAAGGSVGGGRDEELAARWASMPNAVVIPAPMRQAATPTAAPGRLRHEIREGIVERVRAFTLRRMNAAAVAAGGAPASSPLVSSPLAVAPSAPASSAGDPPPPPTTAGAAPR
ncbi:hypothetical protein MMC30_000496 [Trapelia coarctata]|nr:hypothetical protein [Trapelia coarctata]